MMIDFFHTNFCWISTFANVGFTTPLNLISWNFEILNMYEIELTQFNIINNPFFLINFEKIFVFISFSYPYLLILFYFAILSFFCSLFFFFLTKLNFLSSNFYFSFFFNESEKELNSLDDLKYTISIIFFFFFYNFLFYFIFLLIYPNLIFFSIFLIKIILITIPLILGLEYGFYTIIFIRGTTSSTLNSYEFFLDYVNLIAYFVRIFIQTIRIAVILITFYTFNELFIEYYYLFYDKTDYNFMLDLLFINKSYFILCIHLIFELFHLVFIFLLQTVSFHVTIFWLFQFLFTMFFFNVLENFFYEYKTFIC